MYTPIPHTPERERREATFTTKLFTSREAAEASGLGSVHEMKRLNGLPSEWIVRVPK